MPTRGNLRPLSPRILLANTAPNVIGFSAGCTDIRALGEATDWEAPATYRKLSALGPVYRQFYRVQCSVKYPGKNKTRRGKPKKVILCWAGTQQPGLRSNEQTPGRPGAQNPVWVSCSCNYFRYVCEWALTRYGNSDILYSNGQPARITNPRGIGTLCKHLYATIPFAISSWSGEPPEEQVQEPEVVEPPQTPEVLPEEESPPKEDLSSTSEDDTEELDDLQENILKGASFSRTSSGLYIPSHLTLSQSLRSIALSFDSECC